MTTFLGAPIRYGDENLGNLYLTKKVDGQEFTPEDEALLGLFCAQAASAIHNAHLHQVLEAERRRLSESEALYRAVLDNSPAVIYIKDTVGRYILINRRYEQLFGVTQEGIRGKTDTDIFPVEQAEVLQANDRRILDSGIASESEEQVPHDDGLHTYISLKFPFRDAGGAIIGVCGISSSRAARAATVGGYVAPSPLGRLPP